MSGVAEASPKYLVDVARNGIPVGYKQTEVGVIPGDWEVVEFGSALKEFRNGYAFSASGYASTGTPIITMAQIGLSGSFQFDISKVNKWDSEQQDSLKEFWVRDGDLLIAMTDVTPDKNLIGQMAIAKLDGIALLNQRVGLLRLKNEIAYSGYFSFLSCLPVWKTYCKGVASLGVQANISTSDIRKAKVPLPTVKEQTAIANALSDVDALISELEKLIAKKQAIKTATMQQLLTGRTRLPQFALRQDGTPTNSSGTNLDAGTGGPKGEGHDGLRKGTKPSELGEIPEDWEVVSLGDVATFANGKPYEEFVAQDGSYQLITLDSVSIDGELKKKHKAVNFYDGSLLKGDLVCVLSDIAHARLLGLCGLIETDGMYVLNQRMGRIRFNSRAEPKFMRYLINANQEFFRNRGQGSSQRHIYKQDVFELSVALPNRSEQTAIATILSDMDAEIEVLEQRLGKTRQIKQGMMQELLTGKTRLPIT